MPNIEFCGVVFDPIKHTRTKIQEIFEKANKKFRCKNDADCLTIYYMYELHLFILHIYGEKTSYPVRITRRGFDYIDRTIFDRNGGGFLRKFFGG